MRRCLVAVAAFLAPLLIGHAAWALWTDDATASASYTTASLAAPTNPATAAGVCTLVVGDRIDVSWTATASTWADGYEVLRSTTAGGPYSVAGTVVGQAVTTYTDGPLAFSTTYYYVVRSTKNNWRSADTAEVSRTTRSAVCV